jgi:very-short-patch-repair endonuclease
VKHPPIVNRARRLRQKQSVAEDIMWQRLRRNQLNGWGFRRQAPVGRFVVDFLCHKLALVVEVDGPLHDTQEQKLFDASRTAELEQLGWLVVRVNERVVRDAADHVLDWISAVGKLILAKETVPQAMRALNKVPLP